MKIATWNINSVRIRFDAIKQFVLRYNPDILCLQETKTEDEYFPHKEMQSLGFAYHVVRGEKSYNGVAILSKLPIKLVDKFSFVNDHARHVSVIVGDNIELHNFYFPAGGDIADPVINPKFDHKLQYVDNVAEWFKHNRSAEDKIILVGDLNIAPEKHDVWSHRLLLDIVSHTYMETYHFRKLVSSVGFMDAIREFISSDQRLYSWWSYRNKDWRNSDKGRRLDHILMTAPLKRHLVRYDIFKDSRDFQPTSDHVPVLIELNVDKL